MTISYPLNLPDLQFAELTIRPLTANNATRSPFTYAMQVASLQGQMWEAEITLPSKTYTEYRAWESFMLKLNGIYGTFLCGDPIKQTSAGSASTTAGTPVLDGSHSVRDASISISTGLTARTGYLKSGDHIQLGSGATSRLHQVLDDVDLDADGKATIDIFPFLRTDYADGVTVTVDDAKGVFRLKEQIELPKFPGYASLAFIAEEAI